MAISTTERAIEMALSNDDDQIVAAYDWLFENHSDRMEELNLTCCEYVDLLISEGA